MTVESGRNGETDPTLRAADAVFAAEQAVGRARWVVDELHETIASALRVLDDAELDSARARLSDRGNFYLEAAGEHLDRLQTRCMDAEHLIHTIYGHLVLAAEAVEQVTSMFADTDAAELCATSDFRSLATRTSAVGEMVSLAKPLSRTAARHVDRACCASQNVSRPALLQPVTLERSIATAGKELGRADEDVRLLGDVVDHAAASASEAAGIASEITDTARRRMAGHGRNPGPTASPSVGSPAR